MISTALLKTHLLITGQRFLLFPSGMFAILLTFLSFHTWSSASDKNSSYSFFVKMFDTPEEHCTAFVLLKNFYSGRYQGCGASL